MLSNDLLAYSIMHQTNTYGNNRGLPSASHFKGRDPSQVYRFEHYRPLQTVSLPPISSIKKHQQTPMLTEGNLMVLNANTNPPSLASSSASSSPMSSPSLRNSNIVPHVIHNSSPVHNFIKGIKSENNIVLPKKRRQRLGPSCDSCRSRKVKCNAEITVLLQKINHDDECRSFLGPDLFQELLQNRCVDVGDDASILISNQKLIKFKACNSCTNKNITCCFSNGYTKEDITLNTKKPNQMQAINPSQTNCINSISKAKVTKLKAPSATRKFSCINCRKKKIKCVFDKALNKCESCSKKNNDCQFDNM